MMALKSCIRFIIVGVLVLAMASPSTKAKIRAVIIGKTGSTVTAKSTLNSVPFTTPPVMWAMRDGSSALPRINEIKPAAIVDR